LPHAVQASGFRPGRMWIRAHGEVAAGPTGTTFRIANWPDALPLTGDVQPGAADVEALVELHAGNVTLRTARPPRL
jgi:hypothetical protein